MNKTITGQLRNYDIDTKIGHVRADGKTYRVDFHNIAANEVQKAFLSNDSVLYSGSYKNKTLTVDKVEIPSTM